MQALRRRIQVVFQDPFPPLDPRRHVRDVLTRPMRLRRLCDGQEAGRRGIVTRVGRRRHGTVRPRFGAPIGRVPIGS